MEKYDFEINDHISLERRKVYAGWMRKFCFLIISNNWNSVDLALMFGYGWRKTGFSLLSMIQHGLSRKFMWNKDLTLWPSKRFALFILNGLLTEKRAM